MSAHLPIGVLLPTFNSANLLPRHIAGTQAWLPRVEEIVVVDSFSTDGTLPLLRQGVRHPRVTFLTHPPGLYESWNFGIQHLRAKYTYVSTIGDTITPEGLDHLVESAERLETEVLISPPRFVHTAKVTLKEIRWPIHDFVEAAGLREPQRISPLQAFLTTVLRLPAGILGSSASNLYRTDLLHRHPFPTEFGSCGDTAWTVLHALKTAWGITPKIVSEFVFHEPARRLTQVEVGRIRRQLLTLAEAAWEEAMASHRPAPLEDALPAFWQEMLLNQRQFATSQRMLERLRSRSVPWFLDSRAWVVRSRRRTYRSRQKQILKLIACDPSLSQATKFLAKVRPLRPG